MGQYRLAIDMGGTDIKTGVVDDQYRIVRRHVIPTGPERPFEVVVKDMADAARPASLRGGAQRDEFRKRRHDAIRVGLARRPLHRGQVFRHDLRQQAGPVPHPVRVDPRVARQRGDHGSGTRSISSATRRSPSQPSAVAS